MNHKNNIRERLEAMFPEKPQRRCAWVALASVVAGAIGASTVTYNTTNANDMDYAYRRILTLTATCKNEQPHVLTERTELRVGKKLRQFKVNDQIVAIDYLLDRIDAKKCIE